MKTIVRLAHGAVSVARKILTRTRLLHYLDVFVAAFVLALGANKEHVLGAHGWNAWKALLFSAALVGGKAVLEAWRKSSPSSETSFVRLAVDAARAGLTPEKLSQIVKALTSAAGDTPPPK